MVDLDDWSEENMDSNIRVRKACKEIMEWFLYHRGSIRQCSEWIGIPRSTIQYYIHQYISYYWDDEYVQIKNILRYNKKNRFKPRKRWER